MKLSSSGQADDVANNTMMKSMQITMPLMSIFICISLPAGIGIYWSASALLSLLTQIGVNFYYDHQDMDKILAKQMEKAAKKAAKNGGKKSFMERMMDQSAEAQEELEKQQAMRKNSAASLKNYVPSSEAQKAKQSLQTKNGMGRCYNNHLLFHLHKSHSYKTLQSQKSRNQHIQPKNSGTKAKEAEC